MGCVISVESVVSYVRDGEICGITIVRHSQDRNLSDGAISAFHTSCPLIDSGQICVHVTRITTSTRDFLTGRRDLTKGITIGRKIRQDDQDVFLELIGVVFRGGQCKAGCDDTLNTVMMLAGG